MERRSLRTNLKDPNPSVVTRSAMKDSNSTTYNLNYNYKHKVKAWDGDQMNRGSNNYDEDYMNGFSWPPRSYTCSFCKREFRSAQALGGHMNVHRRDRARLRVQSSPPKDGHCTTQCTSSVLLNLDLKPSSKHANPTLSSSSSTPNSTKFKPSKSTLPSLVSPPALLPCSNPSDQLKRCFMENVQLCPLSPKASESTNLKNIAKPLPGFGEYNDHHVFRGQDGCKILKKSQVIRLDLEIGLLSSNHYHKEDIDLELRLGCSQLE